MFNKSFDIVAIGDITTDAFIRLKEASAHCEVNTQNCQLCMNFGDKVPFEYVKVIKAVGNAANAAVSGARLGLKTALISNIGDDQNGAECLAELKKNNVSTTYITKHHGKPTNYHFVLWYEVDRTILVNHVDYDYKLPNFPQPKWIYLTSLGSSTTVYHEIIADYLDKNPDVKLAFQPGTFQIKLGINNLKRIYSRTDVFVVNVEEAQRILQTESRDIKNLCSKIASFGPKIVIITDNTNGAYMFDGDHYYHIPMYPDPRPAFERTGCGDAFASTFVSELARGKSPLEALLFAPINSMSVAQFVGAQEGLLTSEQIEWWSHQAPAEYKVKEI